MKYRRLFLASALVLLSGCATVNPETVTYATYDVTAYDSGGNVVIAKRRVMVDGDKAFRTVMTGTCIACRRSGASSCRVVAQPAGGGDPIEQRC